MTRCGRTVNTTVQRYHSQTTHARALFEKTLRNEVYVDKSMLIETVPGKIGTNNQYICITRPGRFGKSVNLHMLGAYYTKGQDSAALFEKLAVSCTKEYETHWNSHNVIYIDFSRLPDDCRRYKDYIAMGRKGLRRI